MDKFNSIERKIFNLIRSGKSRNEILAEKITTPVNVQFNLSNIYSKTEDLVKYKTARNKFEELACYLRNNPDAFGDTLAAEETKVEEENKEDNAAKEFLKAVKQMKGFEGPVNSDETITSKVKKVIDRISTKLQAKLEILDEVYTEIEKELENAR